MVPHATFTRENVRKIRSEGNEGDAGEKGKPMSVAEVLDIFGTPDSLTYGDFRRRPHIIAIYEMSFQRMRGSGPSRENEADANFFWFRIPRQNETQVVGLSNYSIGTLSEHDYSQTVSSESSNDAGHGD